ncbi:hypothetical protein FIBSPDRAFT_966114 [Athelia psychrophila]|uniref:Uncharacterized protein n=1 Tax=Athelia psychrophila TaxID=1759441 RepID=A0A167X482_9AGAM|nr:hypothetical protein FIBSPDRAFT_966114 [Fibularhizoctonia sp. CBS 109695]
MANSTIPASRPNKECAYAAGGDDNHFHRQHIPLDSGLLHRYLPLLGHSGSKPVRADGTFAALARPPPTTSYPRPARSPNRPSKPLAASI